MSFYMLALASIICTGIWLHHRKSFFLFAEAAVLTVFTLLAGLYNGVGGQRIVCFLLILAIPVLTGKEEE